MPYNGVPASQTGKMEDCVAKVMKRGKGMDKGRAIAVCHASIVGKKELDIDNMTDEQFDQTVKEIEMETKGYVPYGVTSFSDLRAWRDKEEQSMAAMQVADDMMGMMQGVLTDPEMDMDKKVAAVQSIATDFGSEVKARCKKPENKENDDSIVEKVFAKIKGLFGLEDKDKGDGEGEQGMMIWKEDNGQYMWLARYSNNFRDDDNPPEIIAEQSHRDFVKAVDEGQAPLPQLWLWHVPEWKIGQADTVAYDDTGFAIAAGHFDNGKEHIAEWLSKQTDVLVSHGMPSWSIMRDDKDPSIIIRHQTAEISPLPGWAAANKITGFVVMDATKEAVMIPDAKRKALIEQWKIDPSILDALEKQNAQDAEKATEEGRESKETQEQAQVEEKAVESKQEEKKEETQVMEETQETQAVEELEQPVVTPPQADYPTREEIAEAFGIILGEIKDQMNELTLALEGVAKEVKQLKSTDEEKIAKAAQDVPAASLAAMLTQSIIGRKEASVKSNSNLANDKPKETAPVADAQTGIPFIDRMIGQGN